MKSNTIILLQNSIKVIINSSKITIRNIKNILFIILLMSCLTSCVQQTKKQIVVYTVDVSGIKNIKTVGIRGWDNPLSWNDDTEMKVVKKDAIYTITVASETGRICNEFKFSVNGTLELEDKENRKVYFNKSGRTFYKARFNLAK